MREEWEDEDNADEDWKEWIATNLKENAPRKLRRGERDREMDNRDERKLNILVASNGSLMTVGKLKYIVHKTLRIWDNFEQIKIKDNGDVILKVRKMDEKSEILRYRGKFKGTELRYYDDLKERERSIKKWLIQREKVLLEGDVSAGAVYIYGDFCEWI